ncbi:c6 transcription [Moniliophthora roreri MCA 2997]|uniref:C6 transcription n=1 Tax=Moniliophthora roreri (strain MCA 2997) TaxID=1381753 RepID=V2Z2V3_MONRO|nr:c6 transcription [Moniliophthora roreri MCA 2997]
MKCLQLFLTSARALRLSVPLSLNVCPPFHSIAKTARSASLLPAAKTVIDDETRRNTFWLAYAIERCHGIANGWASSLDDQDIFQLLPVRNDQFQRAELVPPSNRQWSHTFVCFASPLNVL